MCASQGQILVTGFRTPYRRILRAAQRVLYVCVCVSLLALVMQIHVRMSGPGQCAPLRAESSVSMLWCMWSVLASCTLLRSPMPMCAVQQ